MRRILSLLSAALTFVACSNPTAPSGDQSANAAKAKSALGAVAKASAGHANGRLSAN